MKIKAAMGVNERGEWVLFAHDNFALTALAQGAIENLPDLKTIHFVDFELPAVAVVKIQERA